MLGFDQLNVLISNEDFEEFMKLQKFPSVM